MIQTTVDILLILIVLYNLLRGWQNGFILGLLDLLSWIGSLLAAFLFYGRVAEWLVPILSLPLGLGAPLAFALTALGAGLALSLLGRLLLERLPARAHSHGVNRIFGLLPGFVSGLVAIAILSSLLLSLPLAGNLRVAARDSALANRFGTLTQQLESELEPIFGEAISETLNLLTIHPQSNETVALPYTVSDAQPVPALEAEMLVLVNQERARMGLSALVMDPALVEVARRHSDDMFRRGYFSHSTPEGLSPFDRIEGAGISYLIAGENLAHAPTLPIAHNGLMNSPGHRENILRAEFGHVGIGILEGGPYGLMITQNFRE